MPDSYFGASDLQPLLDVFGIPVTIGGVTAKCIRDTPDLEMATAEDGGVYWRNIKLRAVTGAFPALAAGVGATVEGVACTVTQQLLIGDGAYTEIHCRKN